MQDQCERSRTLRLSSQLSFIDFPYLLSTLAGEENRVGGLWEVGREEEEVEEEGREKGID